MLMVIQQQERLSVSDLSDIVSLSPFLCVRRVKHLEDEGYIHHIKYVIQILRNINGLVYDETECKQSLLMRNLQQRNKPF